MSDVQDEKPKKSEKPGQIRTTGDTRRNLLKTALAGGSALAAAQVLPKKWVTPVVDSVILPAHAQASVTGGAGTFTTGGPVPVARRALDPSDRHATTPSMGEKLVELMMPTAHAQAGQTLEMNLVITESLATFCGISENELTFFATTSSVDLATVPPTVSGPVSLLVDLVVTDAQFAGNQWTVTFGDGSSVDLTPGGDGCLPPDNGAPE